jgi:hypothetical protein
MPCSPACAHARPWRGCRPSGARSSCATGAPFARPFRLQAVTERFTEVVVAEVDRLLGRLEGLRLDPARPSAPSGLVFRKPPSVHVLWAKKPD